MLRWSLIPLVALGVATSSHASARLVADSKHPTAKTTPHVSAAEMHLRVGDTYEKNGQFDKAEQEYVIAATAEDGTPDTQVRSLNGVERILEHSADRNLQIAETYEQQEQWSDAETYYLKAADSARTPAQRQTAIDGIKRVRQQVLSPLATAVERTEWLSKLGTLLIRLAGAVLVLLIVIRFLLALRAVASSTKIWKFEGDEQFANLIQTSFPAIRAKAYSVTGSFNSVKLPQNLSTIYPFVPLHLSEYLPEEAIEVGELKIPSLSSLLRLLVRPRFEIEGGVSTSDSGSFVYAHIWRNKWFMSKLHAVATAMIPKIDINGAALELFVYDVYLKISPPTDSHELA